MKNFRSLLMISAIVSSIILFCACDRVQNPPAGSSAGITKIDPTPDVIAENKGKVMVILMGMEGCPGTEGATPFITEYCKSKPDGVAVYRIDVPPPGKVLQKAANLDSNLNYVIDNDRSLAGKLEFFFYPTTFILDRDGSVRFAGACEPEQIKKMVGEISAEKPDSEKKMYTPPLLKIGEPVKADLKFADSAGKEIALKDVCGDSGAILFFSTTNCPFSVKALADLEKIKTDFKDKKFNYAIVSFGETAETIKNTYAEKSPGSMVLIDKDKEISDKVFGVSAVPFFYVLDKDMKVVDRRPFQYETAKAAIAKTLGVSCGPGGKAPSSGAG